jgi:hypothetical protein
MGDGVGCDLDGLGFFRWVPSLLGPAFIDLFRFGKHSGLNTKQFRWNSGFRKYGRKNVVSTSVRIPTTSIPDFARIPDFPKIRKRGGKCRKRSGKKRENFRPFSTLIISASLSQQNTIGMVLVTGETPLQKCIIHCCRLLHSCSVWVPKRGGEEANLLYPRRCELRGGDAAAACLCWTLSVVIDLISVLFLDLGHFPCNRPYITHGW